MNMTSSRIVIALVSAVLLFAGFTGPAFAKGNSVSHEPSRLFEGVPRSTPERSAGQRGDQETRTPRKGAGCTGLLEILCN
jgi:hypothetical protein